MFRLKIKERDSYQDPIIFVGDYTAVVELLDKIMTVSNAGKFSYTIEASLEDEEENDE